MNMPKKTEPTPKPQTKEQKVQESWDLGKSIEWIMDEYGLTRQEVLKIVNGINYD